MTIDERIIWFRNQLLEERQISKKKEFYLATGISRQNFRMIEKEGRHFTTAHILAICKAYSLNANWVFGFEDEIFRFTKKSTQNEQITNKSTV